MTNPRNKNILDQKPVCYHLLDHRRLEDSMEKAEKEFAEVLQAEIDRVIIEAFS